MCYLPTSGSQPHPQLLGQLPADRVNPCLVFESVGVDYAGPILTKAGSALKPTIVKSYMCVFVCFAVKAVHLELVSDLTTAAFLATLRCFIARRGKPMNIRSDHGANIVGAARELKELYGFLCGSDVQRDISGFCMPQNIQRHFIPEHVPHFGGLWEAAVKSFKYHLRRIVWNVHLTFKELATTLAQIEACLNSRPLTPLLEVEDGAEVLTPGHFLIDKPIEALPDHSTAGIEMSVLGRRRLCQRLVQHFWQRWSAEYLSQLQRFSKWAKPMRDLKVGDIVCMRDENMVPTRWPLTCVIEVHPGVDGRVRVVTICTSKGTYRRPVIKITRLPVDASF